MQTLTHDMVSASGVHEFSADASDLKFPVGHYPRQIPTSMGNGLPFLLWSVSGECAIYRQSNGCVVLRVFND